MVRAIGCFQLILDYCRLEKKIVNRLLLGDKIGNDKLVIHYSTVVYGFGNQLRSLLGSVVFALVTGRRLRSIFDKLHSIIVVWDDYFRITNSSFEKLKSSFNKSKIVFFFLLIAILKEPNIKYITNSVVSRFMKQVHKNNIDEYFPTEVVVVHTYKDWTYRIADIPMYKQKLKDLGLLTYSNDVHFLLSRLLLQPSQEIMSSILYSLNDKNNDFSKCIGLQIRMGGKMTAAKADKEFLKVDTVVKGMKNISVEYTHNESVYLSTDSLQIIPIIKSHIGNHSIIQSNSFTIGHSSTYHNNRKKTEAMKRGLCDIILASHCKPLYRTYYSSFGRMIFWLSTNSFSYILGDKDLITIAVR